VKTAHQIIERRQRSIRTVAVLFVVFLLASLALPLGERLVDEETADRLVTTADTQHVTIRNGSPDFMAAY
jgi:hypothetical protein